jgi:hypothetical protein
MHDLQVGNPGSEQGFRLAQSKGNRFGGRSGQAMILGTLTLSVLFGAVGLAADLGFSYFTKQQVQTAADAATSAAAYYAYSNNDTCSTITCGVSYTCAGVNPPTNSLQAGCLYATADAPSGSTVTMIENDGAHPPSGMTGNTPSMWIKSTVTTSHHNAFLYWDGFHTASVLGQAVGGFTTIQSGGCIYAMSPTASKAVTITGTSTVTTAGCGVYINSNATDALYLNGSPYLAATGGGTISVNGGDSISVGGHALPDPSPAPLLHNGAVADPLASVPAPPYSGCSHSTGSGTSSETNYSLGHSDTATRGPGVYCGGITVSGSAVLTLNAGTYIMNGGGFNVGNSGRVIATSGVMIYNTVSAGQTAGSVSIGGNARVDLTAPGTGTYSGIAFFQDRSMANAANISNSANGTITGTYYFYDAPFSFTGNTATATTAAFVASTITVTGSSNLSNDSTGKLTGLARTTVAVMQ